MGGIATPPLALAVAEAGALGMVGAAMVPAPILAEQLDRLGARTQGAFGVSFLMPFLDRDAVAVASTRARVVEFFYAEPDATLVDIVHTRGALACWQVGSVEEAVAATRAGCDFVIAQGTEAGGHVRGRVGLLPLLSAVLDAVGVPVVAAGGIGTARTMAAALAAGADAVRVGTRFVAAVESNAHPDYVAALIDARTADTVLTGRFSVMWPDAPHRVLRSAVAAAEACADEVVGEMEIGGAPAAPRFAVPAPPAAPPERSRRWRSTPVSRSERSAASRRRPTSCTSCPTAPSNCCLTGRRATDASRGAPRDRATPSCTGTRAPCPPRGGAHCDSGRTTSPGCRP